MVSSCDIVSITLPSAFGMNLTLYFKDMFFRTVLRRTYLPGRAIARGRFAEI